MDKKRLILFFEIFIFLLIFSLTFIEIFSFKTFERIFIFSVEYLSWFVSFSFGYVLSKLLEEFLISLYYKFSKKSKNPEQKEKGTFFGFLIIMLFIAIGISYFKDLVDGLFNHFFIYFHILFMQAIILFYLYYKLKNNYEIPLRTFLFNEFLVLANTLIIILFI